MIACLLLYITYHISQSTVCVRGGMLCVCVCTVYNTITHVGLFPVVFGSYPWNEEEEEEVRGSVLTNHS
jgi:hypothetical protein